MVASHEKGKVPPNESQSFIAVAATTGAIANERKTVAAQTLGVGDAGAQRRHITMRSAHDGKTPYAAPIIGGGLLRLADRWQATQIKVGCLWQRGMHHWAYSARVPPARNSKFHPLLSSLPMHKTTSVSRTLDYLHERGFLTEPELKTAESMFEPGFQFAAALQLADSIHLHIRVDDTEALPREDFFAQGAAFGALNGMNYDVYWSVLDRWA